MVHTEQPSEPPPAEEDYWAMQVAIVWETVPAISRATVQNKLQKASPNQICIVNSLR